MEKKKLKLTISGSSKKTINNIEIAKSQGKNSVIIEKKPAGLVLNHLFQKIIIKELLSSPDLVLFLKCQYFLNHL